MNEARILFVVAAHSEAFAVAQAYGRNPLPSNSLWKPLELSGGIWMVQTGVGKANAAGATAAALCKGMFGAVVNIGIGGALPRKTGRFGVGSVVIASEEVFADEGIILDGGFLDLTSQGFGSGLSGQLVPPDPGVTEFLHQTLAGIGGERARMATVSGCSGSDEAEAAVALRTDAAIETMEGAAVLLAAARLGVPCGEVRVVSNRTGNRDGQQWNLPASLAQVSLVAKQIGAAYRAGVSGRPGE